MAQCLAGTADLQIPSCKDALQVGLGVAVEYALGLGMTNMWERIHGLAALMRRKLLEQPISPSTTKAAGFVASSASP